MTTNELIDLFREDIKGADILYFDKIENKKSNRKDLHAFLLLDSLVPDTGRIICAAEHDEIYLAPTLDELAKVITYDQVIELKCCGVLMDDYGECLRMFA